MTMYRVEWAMDFDADTPQQAAQMALGCFGEIEAGNIDAKVFDVTEHDGSGEAIRVDLCDEPHDTEA